MQIKRTHSQAYMNIYLLFSFLDSLRWFTRLNTDSRFKFVYSICGYTNNMFIASNEWKGNNTM